MAKRSLQPLVKMADQDRSKFGNFYPERTTVEMKSHTWTRLQQFKRMQKGSKG